VKISGHFLTHVPLFRFIYMRNSTSVFRPRFRQCLNSFDLERPNTCSKEELLILVASLRYEYEYEYGGNVSNLLAHSTRL
jgi:hypothetical protein